MMGLIRSNPNGYLGRMVKTPDGSVARLVAWDIDVGPTMIVWVTYITPWRFSRKALWRKSEFYDDEIDEIKPLELPFVGAVA